MDIREFSSSYARSPLGLGSLLASFVAGTAAALLGIPIPLSVLIALASFAVLLVLALALGFGQRAAVGEVDREARGAAASRIAEAAGARQRLAALRLPAGEGAAGEVAASSLAKARDLLVLEAGSFIEDCGRAGTWDPEGVAAIVDSLALVDAWLKEADESSVEKRFDLPDANPFPEAAARTARVLREKARIVSARRSAALGEIPGADRIAIEEELK